VRYHQRELAFASSQSSRYSNLPAPRLRSDHYDGRAQFDHAFLLGRKDEIVTPRPPVSTLRRQKRVIELRGAHHNESDSKARRWQI